MLRLRLKFLPFILFPVYCPAAWADLNGPSWPEVRACAQRLVEGVAARSRLGALTFTKFERYSSNLGLGETYYRFEARHDSALLRGYVYPKVLQSIVRSVATGESEASGECAFNTVGCGPSLEIRDEAGNVWLRLGRECGFSMRPRPGAIGPH